MTGIRRFLVWASGADPALMADPGCKADQHRYAIFGTLGVFVALMGSASAAMTGTLFTRLALAIWPAALWGAYVLVLERAIMSGIVSPRNGGGLRRVALVAVRLALAAAVGFAITTGFALRFFGSAIDRSLAQQNLAELNSAQQRIDSLVGGELHALRTQRAMVDSTIAVKQVEVTNAFAVMEAEGTGRRSPYAGPGKLWRADSAHAADLQVELLALRDKADVARTNLDRRIDSLAGRRDGMLTTVRAVQHAGPADRLRALYRLERADPAIRIESVTFFLLLLMIDITPAMVKLLSSTDRDGYEALVQRLRAEMIAKQDAAADIAVSAAKGNATVAGREEAARQRRVMVALEHGTAVIENAWLRVVQEALTSEAFKTAREEVARGLADLFIGDQEAVMRSVRRDDQPVPGAATHFTNEMRRDRRTAMQQRAAADQMYRQVRELTIDPPTNPFREN